MKYYLVVFKTSNCTGNMFFKCKTHLNIRKAEKTIGRKYDVDIVVITNIIKIEKEQWVKKMKPTKKCVEWWKKQGYKLQWATNASGTNKHPWNFIKEEPDGF